MPVLGELVKLGDEMLRDAGVEDSRLTSSLLLAEALGKDRVYLLAHDRDEVEPQIQSCFFQYIKRRAQGEPLQYITGRQEFYGFDFHVTPAVLIPRPETELIVELALKYIKTPNTQILDIGTGSGCIAVSLAKLLPSAHVTALDISPAAIAVARRNAAKHGVLNRIDLIVSDLCSALSDKWRYSVVCSNPPYVAEQDAATLAKEVRDYEPHLALFAPNDGLEMIHRVFLEAARVVSPESVLLMEIGYRQAERIEQMAGNYWEIVDIACDLQGIPRTVVARRK